MRTSFRVFLATSAVLLFGGASCLSLPGQSSDRTSGPAGLFVSSDKGAVWSASSNLVTAQGVKSLSTVSVFKTVDDPQDSQAFYWLSRANGLFYTYDEGRSWQQVKGPLATGFVYALAVHPKNKCLVYVSNGTQLFKTDDCSRSWTELYREARTAKVVGITFDPFDPSRVIIVTDSGDVVQSLDEGNTWQVLNRLKKRTVGIESDKMQQGVFYVYTRSNGLYRTTDDGETWLSLRETMKEFTGALEYRRMVVHPQKAGLLYWVSTYGILVSADSGDTWRAMKLITPPGSAQIYGFAINPNNENEVYYTATINSRSTFYKSVDGGESWKTEKLPSGQLPTMIRVHPDKTKQNVIYLGFTIPPSQ